MSGNLVLSRHCKEDVVIDLREINLAQLADPIIRIGVNEIRGDKTRLGIHADKLIPVHRGEVFNAIEREKNQRPAA